MKKIIHLLTETFKYFYGQGRNISLKCQLEYMYLWIQLIIDEFIMFITIGSYHHKVGQFNQNDFVQFHP